MALQSNDCALDSRGVASLGQNPVRMLVCDLDGTLLVHGAPFDPLDLRTLRALGADGVVRVIATGRALATAQKVIAADFPIDYLIFSSGAGIMDWRTQELLLAHTMQPVEVAVAARALSPMASTS